MKGFKMKIYIDIDETICVTPASRDYSLAEPIKGNIKLANKLYEHGHEITYYTARGSGSGRNWEEVTERQLDDWGCKRHGLKFGKPTYDILIDDKTINTMDWQLVGNDIIDELQVVAGK
jgi:hypothetical protein